ncbi:MAG TPA: DUF3015 family protein [Anaeromyxobacter sp.]
MRKFLVALGLALVATTAAAQSQHAKQSVKGTGTYGLAGCGLGSLIFENQPGGVQILAATTNGSTSWNQTWAITSGTSNCGAAAFASGTKNFVDANREAVAKDISRGQGEAIGALTQINLCADSSAVGSALQKRFQQIFPAADSSTEAVTAEILKTLHDDKSLGCGQG